MMKFSPASELDELLSSLAEDVRAVLSAPLVALGAARPPSGSGVYILSVGGEVTYVGEAKGSKGLRDRLVSKHLSGDDNHAAQRAFLTDFPDRVLRRRHIKENVHVRWVEISDRNKVAAVERLLICLLQPPWNRT